MEDVWLYIPIVAILIALSGFFSSSETALTSVNQIRLRQRATEGDKKSMTVLKLLEKPQDVISSILIGNNIVNIASSAVATVFFTQLFGASGPVVATVVMTILVLIFGEVLPKTAAQQQPEMISRKVAKPISRITMIFKPVVFLLTALSGLVTKWLFSHVDEAPTITEEEFKARGVNVVIYANQLTRTGFPAMQNAARTILENHRAKECDDICMSIKDIITLIPEES